MACLLISIVSWFLGGFFPVVGAPVFAIFAGMLLHPGSHPYKQLDAGLTFSSKKLLQYAVILLGFGLNISQVFAVGQSFTPRHPFHHFDFLNRCLHLFQRFFALDTKLATLIEWGLLSVVALPLLRQRPLSMPRKRSCPSHFRYLFLQCLGCAHLSNSRNLASPIQWRLLPSLQELWSMILLL